MVQLLLSRVGHFCFQLIMVEDCCSMHYAVYGGNIQCINALCNFRESYGHFMIGYDADTFDLLKIAHASRYPYDSPFELLIWPRQVE